MEEVPPPPPPPPPPEENNSAEGRLRRKPHSDLRRRSKGRRAKPKRNLDKDENDGNSSNSSTSSSTDTEEGGDGAPVPLVVAHGSVSLIGHRKEMEDALTEAPGFLASHDFFAVFDGHGGATVAMTCRERIHVVLAEEAAAADGDEERWREAMAACFAKVDREVAEAAAATVTDGTVGSTAVVAVVGERRIVVANCGDSRTVLCRGGAAVPLSSDHKEMDIIRTTHPGMRRLSNQIRCDMQLANHDKLQEIDINCLDVDSTSSDIIFVQHALRVVMLPNTGGHCSDKAERQRLEVASLDCKVECFHQDNKYASGVVMLPDSGGLCVDKAKVDMEVCNVV